MSLHLCSKRSPGEGEAFLMLGSPLLIGSPEVADTTPGVGMQFTARVEKSLQGIVRGAGMILERQRSPSSSLSVAEGMGNLLSASLIWCFVLLTYLLLEKLRRERSRGKRLRVSVSQDLGTDVFGAFSQGERFVQVVPLHVKESQVMQRLRRLRMLRIEMLFLDG